MTDNFVIGIGGNTTDVSIGNTATSNTFIGNLVGNASSADKVNHSLTIGDYVYDGSTPITISKIDITNGGTGATTAEEARANLDITPANIGALALSGGTMTGKITKDAEGSSWIGGRNAATIKNINVSSAGAWFPITSSKTPNGSFEIGTLGESFWFSYASDENYEADSNATVLTQLTKDGVFSCNGLTVSGNPYHQTYYGTTAPDNSTGQNGDIYIKYNA